MNVNINVQVCYDKILAKAEPLVYVRNEIYYGIITNTLY